MDTNKAAHFMKAVEKMLPRGKFTHVDFYHDEGCPCIEGTTSLVGCRCDPWVVIEGNYFQMNASGQLARLERR